MVLDTGMVNSFFPAGKVRVGSELRTPHANFVAAVTVVSGVAVMV